MAWSRIYNLKKVSGDFSLNSNGKSISFNVNPGGGTSSEADTITGILVFDNEDVSSLNKMWWYDLKIHSISCDNKNLFKEEANISMELGSYYDDTDKFLTANLNNFSVINTTWTEGSTSEAYYRFEDKATNLNNYWTLPRGTYPAIRMTITSANNSGLANYCAAFTFGDIFLIATFNDANNYITFYDDGTMLKEFTLDDYENAIQYIPQKNGYKFIGWTDGTIEYPLGTNIFSGSATTLTTTVCSYCGTSYSTFYGRDVKYTAMWESEGSNIYLGNQPMDVYLGNVLMDVYVGNILI